MPSEPRELHVRLHGFIHGRQARQWRKILARLESLFDGHRVYTRTRTRAQTRAADVMPRSATFRLSRGTEPARFSRGTELSNGKDEKGKGREGGKKGRRGRRKEEEEEEVEERRRYKEKEIRYYTREERKGFCLWYLKRGTVHDDSEVDGACWERDVDSRWWTGVKLSSYRMEFWRIGKLFPKWENIKFEDVR